MPRRIQWADTVPSAREGGFGALVSTRHFDEDAQPMSVRALPTHFSHSEKVASPNSSPRKPGSENRPPGFSAAASLSVSTRGAGIGRPPIGARMLSRNSSVSPSPPPTPTAQREKSRRRDEGGEFGLVSVSAESGLETGASTGAGAGVGAGAGAGAVVRMGDGGPLVPRLLRTYGSARIAGAPSVVIPSFSNPDSSLRGVERAEATLRGAAQPRQRPLTRRRLPGVVVLPLAPAPMLEAPPMTRTRAKQLLRRSPPAAFTNALIRQDDWEFEESPSGVPSLSAVGDLLPPTKRSRLGIDHDSMQPPLVSETESHGFGASGEGGYDGGDSAVDATPLVSPNRLQPLTSSPMRSAFDRAGALVRLLESGGSNDSILCASPTQILSSAQLEWLTAVRDGSSSDDDGDEAAVAATVTPASTSVPVPPQTTTTFASTNTSPPPSMVKHTSDSGTDTLVVGRSEKGTLARSETRDTGVELPRVETADVGIGSAAASFVEMATSPMPAFAAAVATLRPSVSEVGTGTDMAPSTPVAIPPRALDVSSILPSPMEIETPPEVSHTPRKSVRWELPETRGGASTAATTSAITSLCVAPFSHPTPDGVLPPTPSESIDGEEVLVGPLWPLTTAGRAWELARARGEDVPPRPRTTLPQRPLSAQGFDAEELGLGAPTRPRGRSSASGPATTATSAFGSGGKGGGGAGAAQAQTAPPAPPQSQTVDRTTTSASVEPLVSSGPAGFTSTFALGSGELHAAQPAPPAHFFISFAQPAVPVAAPPSTPAWFRRFESMTLAALAENPEVRIRRAALLESPASASPAPSDDDVHMTLQESGAQGGAASYASPESQATSRSPSVDMGPEEKVMPTLTKGLAFAAEPVESGHGAQLRRSEPSKVPTDDEESEHGAGAMDVDIEHDKEGDHDAGYDGAGDGIEVIDDEGPTASQSGTRSVGHDDCPLLNLCPSVATSSRLETYYERDIAVSSRGPFTESAFAPFAFRLNAGIGAWTAPTFVTLPHELSASLHAAAATTGRSVFVSAADAAGRTYKPAALGDFSLPVFEDAGELKTYGCPLASASFGAGHDFHSALERLTNI